MHLSPSFDRSARTSAAFIFNPLRLDVLLLEQINLGKKTKRYLFIYIFLFYRYLKT